MEHINLPNLFKKDKNLSKKKKPKTGQGNPYKHPIPSRNDLLDMMTDINKPIKIESILKAYDLKGQRMRSLLLDQLRDMANAKLIFENKKNEFSISKNSSLVTGKFSSHRDGYGFIICDDDSLEDIFVSAQQAKKLFDGDKVSVQLAGHDYRGRLQGKIVKILERTIKSITGQFIRDRNCCFVLPENSKLPHRIVISKDQSSHIKNNSVVVVEILSYPKQNKLATGRITSVIGEIGDKGIITEIAIHSHGIPFDWPDSVKQEAQKFGRNISVEDKKRIDLRDLNLITIDGADARDFDDAVFCEKKNDGWRLIVAIADVADYVNIDSALDKEAIRRGTSVYFPDRVIPMLPEVLSNGLCSLNPKVDRLCIVCDMQVNDTGKILKTNFFEGLMKSKARLTYNQVGDFLKGKSKSSLPKELHNTVRNLHQLYKVFEKNRKHRGAIEINIPQTKFVLNDEGSIGLIKVEQRNDAHRLIEECMIAANIEAAKFLKKHKIPNLYRVHPKPDNERFNNLRQYLILLGLKVPHPNHVQPQHFNQLIDQVKDRPDSAAIKMIMLRSLMHAEYSPSNIGHFGLALDYYAHFTSPIRRYPDLLVHRAIKYVIHNKKTHGFYYSKKNMEHFGEITSSHEKRAEDATRDVEARLKCEYMEKHIGEVYKGIITGVTNFGLFIQINELLIDGLVHVKNLNDDFYRYEADAHRLIGERTGRFFCLGDETKIRVKNIDMETRKIDFYLA